MKLIVFYFCFLLLFINLSATQEKSPIQTKTDIPETEDMWDVLLQFDVDTPTGQTGLAGMEWDGTYFYASKWSGSDQLFKFDAEGNYIEPITVPLTGCRDMAYDGTYMYGSPASSFVSCWESETGVPVPGNFITVPGATVRALAYDEVTDSFWSGNWGDNIVKWDRTGTILESYPWSGSLYGLAYEYQLGHHLYAHSQDTGCVVYQLDIDNNLAQLSVHDFTAIGGVGAIAGGACFMNDWGVYNNLFTLGLLLQGSPDYIAVVEIYFWGGIEAPNSPQNVIIQPDLGGALVTDLSWNCPVTNVGGDPLLELLEMRVYRNDELIYTDDDPIIGGQGECIDNSFSISGLYEYRIAGSNSWGEGIPYTEDVWIGEDVPAAVEELLFTDLFGNALLTWENPTSGLHGGAFNEPILGYHIERNDGVVFELAGIQTYYIDCTIPVAGYYSYIVQPYNTIGDGGIAQSNLPLIGGSYNYFEDAFEYGLIHWDVINNGNPGGWQLYEHNSFPNTYLLPPTSTGSVCGADSDENNPIYSELVSIPQLDFSNYNQVQLQFDNDFMVMDESDFAYIDVSNDGGNSWNNIETWNEDRRQSHEYVDISEYAAGFDDVRVRFVSEQPGWDWWWVIDNIYIQGWIHHGYIEGQVTLNGGNGNVANVEILANDIIYHPAPIGYYFINLPVGIYDITASLNNYESVTIEDVIVTHDSTTSGIDFTLNYNGSNTSDELIAESGITSIYPNPFNPSTTISFSVTQTSSFVELEIFNLKGQRVKQLLSNQMSTGKHDVDWNGEDDAGKSVSSGIYFCRLKCGDVVQTKRMLLLK